jgi:Erv1 / Alr family
MGISPDVWGPNLWGTLHLLCLTGSITPEFVQEFAKVIPCPMCASHFQALLITDPFPDTEQFEWSVRLHNVVNERLGKPSFTVEQARARWTRGSQIDFKIIIAVVLFLLLILFACVRK